MSWRRRRSSQELLVGCVPERSAGQDAFTRSDLRESLRAAMGSLPPRQRAVIVLRYFNDLTEIQTAAVLGCSAGAVKSHTARAIAKLRQAPGLDELLSEGIGA